MNLGITTCASYQVQLVVLNTPTKKSQVEMERRRKELFSMTTFGKKDQRHPANPYVHFWGPEVRKV